jgi:hypothetical protein
MSEIEESIDMDVESVAIGHGTQTSQSQNVVASADQSQDVPDVSMEGGRKEMAERSDVWQYFIKIKDDKDIFRQARCKYCH